MPAKPSAMPSTCSAVSRSPSQKNAIIAPNIGVVAFSSEAVPAETPSVA